MNCCLLSVLLLAVFCFVGCRSYKIDSNPQGLRVTLDDLEQGVTPCEVTVGLETSHNVTVVPPTNQQLQAYEETKGVVVSTWINGSQSKTIRSISPSGSMFFEFISSEYNRPTTEDGWKRLQRDLDHDAKELERKRQQVLKVELPVTK